MVPIFAVDTALVTDSSNKVQCLVGEFRKVYDKTKLNLVLRKRKFHDGSKVRGFTQGGC